VLPLLLWHLLQALSINIQLQYNQDQEAAAAAATLSRPGVVIGGGHNLPRRGGGMRHSRSDGAMAAALQASLESSQAESLMRQTAAEAAAPSSVTFSAEDFPTVSGTGMAGTTPLGTWVGASPSGEPLTGQHPKVLRRIAGTHNRC
jgi:hypothetical protein